MELYLLRSFLAVSETLSFVRAAESLHLSQSALTGQIQRLEEDLDVQLFARTKRKVELTDAGSIFVNEATETLERAAKAIERVRRASRGEVGLLRVGFVSSAALEIVPAIATAFRRRYPSVQLDLMNLRTTTQLEQIAEGMLDVGFIRLPAQAKDAEIQPVHSEPFVIALSRYHPLAKQKTLKVSDLTDQPFVLYGRRWAPGYFDQIMAILAKEKVTPMIEQETGEMYTAIALVAAGQSVTIVPRSVAVNQGKGIVTRTIPAKLGESRIAVVTRSGSTSQVRKNFLDLVKQSRNHKGDRNRPM